MNISIFLTSIQEIHLIHQNIHFDVLMFCLLINTTKHIYLCTFLSLYLRSREKEKYEKKEKAPDWTDNHYALTGIIFYSAEPNLPAAHSQERQVSRRSRQGGGGKKINQEVILAPPLGSVRVQARVSGSSQELLPPALAGVCKNSFRLRLFSAVRLTLTVACFSLVFFATFFCFLLIA